MTARWALAMRRRFHASQGCEDSALGYRVAALQVGSHFATFEQVYDDRYQAKYGFWRPVVEQSVTAFLKCGDLHEGFARVRCPDCGHEMFVAYSCKQRCTCPSCHQKRALLTAIHVAEEVCLSLGASKPATGGGEEAGEGGQARLFWRSLVPAGLSWPVSRAKGRFEPELFRRPADPILTSIGLPAGDAATNRFQLRLRLRLVDELAPGFGREKGREKGDASNFGGREWQIIGLIPFSPPFSLTRTAPLRSRGLQSPVVWHCLGLDGSAYTDRPSCNPKQWRGADRLAYPLRAGPSKQSPEWESRLVVGRTLLGVVGSSVPMARTFNSKQGCHTDRSPARAMMETQAVPPRHF